MTKIYLLEDWIDPILLELGEEILVLCPPQHITEDEIRGNTPYRYKYLKFLFDNI